MSELSSEEIYFAYGATLRIHGASLPMEEITACLGVSPTHTHRNGEKRNAAHRGYSDNAWHYAPPLGEERHLSEHLDALWSSLKPHRDYIMALKKKYKVDVFCGYRSNCDHAGLEIPFQSLAYSKLWRCPLGFRSLSRNGPNQALEATPENFAVFSCSGSGALQLYP